MVARAISFTSCWNFSFFATKSVSQFTCTQTQQKKRTCLQLPGVMYPNRRLLLLTVSMCMVPHRTSTMTAFLSCIRRPMSPSFARRPSSLLALLQPSFWACSFSQFSACNTAELTHHTLTCETVNITSPKIITSTTTQTYGLLQYTIYLKMWLYVKFFVLETETHLPLSRWLKITCVMSLLNFSSAALQLMKVYPVFFLSFISKDLSTASLAQPVWRHLSCCGTHSCKTHATVRARPISIQIMTDTLYLKTEWGCWNYMPFFNGHWNTAVHLAICC